MNSIRSYYPLLTALLLHGTAAVAAADSFEVNPNASQSASLGTAVRPGASDTYDPEPPIASHGTPLPCLTRLKSFASVNFILIGTRNDGVDANFARGSFVESKDLSLAQFDSVHNTWLFASRGTCEEPTGGPEQLVPGCAVYQPFTARAASYLEVSLREDGQLVLADGSAPWSSFLAHGQFSAAQVQQLQKAQADALAEAGRALAAADAYVAARAGAPPEALSELELRAAEQCFYAGELARGLEHLGAALRPLGIRVPTSTTEILLSIGYHELWLNTTASRTVDVWCGRGLAPDLLQVA